jgi:hypothetical protein
VSVGYGRAVGPDAPEGTREIKVLATAGAVRAEGRLKITVRKAETREPAPSPESKP